MQLSGPFTTLLRTLYDRRRVLLETFGRLLVSPIQAVDVLLAELGLK